MAVVLASALLELALVWRELCLLRACQVSFRAVRVLHQAMVVVVAFFLPESAVAALAELLDQALLEQAALVLHQEVWVAVVLQVVLLVLPHLRDRQKQIVRIVLYLSRRAV